LAGIEVIAVDPYERRLLALARAACVAILWFRMAPHYDDADVTGNWAAAARLPLGAKWSMVSMGYITLASPIVVSA
jgi:hypothetical protein